MDYEIGKIYAKPSFSFDWKIPNISSRLKGRESFESPSFEFCGETWRLIVQKVSFYIKTLMLERNTNNTQHVVIYCVNILCKDGSEFALVKSKYEFDELHNQCDLYDFDKRVKLLQDQEIPTETLTLSCSLRCQHHPQDFAMHLIDVPTSEDKSNEEKTNDEPEKEDSISTTEKDVNPIVIDSEKLLQDMETLLLSEKDSDATFVVQDRKFLVHRAILGVRSSVLEAMFRHDMVESTSGEANITDFDPDIFQDFLYYIYTSKLKKLSEDNVVGLYSAADKYNTQDLKAKCVEFMRENLSVGIFCSVVSLSLQHQESALLEVAMKYFVDNLKEIILTVEWQAFLRENPTAANELLIKASDFYVPPKQNR